MQAGSRVSGTMIRSLRNPSVTYFAKNAGLEFIMFDCEHSVFSFESLHDCFLTANALGLDGYVRVPVGSKDYISRVLDAGAKGVMVPMTETVEQAKTVVRYAKYLPVGERGYTAGCAHTNFMPGKHSEVMQAGNDSVVAIAQIETRLAIENVDAIAAVDGIDALLVGPNDLSVSLGIPGDLTNPIELEAIGKVADACKKHGKFFGLHAGPALLEKFIDSLQLVMISTDNDMLSSGMANIKKSFDELNK